MVLTGGVDTFNDIFMYTCFSKTPALSPTGDARPFDAAADGTILGEGLGMVVLKRLDDARRDGDRIYAVMRGLGSSSDGKGNAIYAPRAEGQVEALRKAYRVAGVTPDTIELVEAHGTGTRVGDATEVGGVDRSLPRSGGAKRRVVRSGFGQVADWPHQGGGRRRRAHQGGGRAASQGAAADDQGSSSRSSRCSPATRPFYVNTEPRPWLPSDGIRAAPPSAPSASAAAISTASSKKPTPHKASHRLGRRRADPRVHRLDAGGHRAA